jgi:hypothetical protein
VPGLKPEKLVIVKLSAQGVETWRYMGSLLKRTEQSMLIEAFFNRNDLPFHGILLGRGDRFIEAYFSRHWYNIFEMHDRSTDELKGWYCNVTRPAVFYNGRIDYTDLALDLLVYPNGNMLLLDEDEFDELELSSGERQNALAAVDELQEIFKSHPGMPLAELFVELSTIHTEQPPENKDAE